MTAVLIIDDESTLRGLIARVIQLEGYSVSQASNIKEALKLLQRDQFQVVITDVKLPDGNGVDLTTTIRKAFPGTEVIVITAYGTIEDGVKAIKNGAFDYLTKGDHQERIIPILSKAAEKALLQQKVINLESRLQYKFGFESILGSTKAIKQNIELAKKVAVTDTTVLILGQTGTGKEVFAQAIHYESSRSSKSFIALNCSAFPKDLLESELFGSVEGSYTGSTRTKKGYLEEAHEGTLFLDEIGELNLDLQAKLLRVLETGEFYRIGESKPRKVNVRFIAATNRDIKQESQAGTFRSDLFYRLSVFSITLPTLSERKEDIPVLMKFFVTQFAVKTNKREPSVSGEFIKALQQHPWRGNIRELKNVIERAVILSEGQLTPSLLPPDFDSTEDVDSMELSAVEKKHILKTLRYTGGNKAETARLLGIGISTLYRKIDEYSL